MMTHPTHRIRRLVAVLSLFATSAYAQSITGGDLSRECIAKAEARAGCILIVKAFMDGFIEGVGKGVLGVYAFDLQVRTLVADTPMKELAPRIQEVNEKAVCLDKISVEALAAAFVRRVEAEPSLRARHYREALTRTISAEYCSP